jgi:hypothetical protein
MSVVRMHSLTLANAGKRRIQPRRPARPAATGAEPEIWAP